MILPILDSLFCRVYLKEVLQDGQATGNADTTSQMPHSGQCSSISGGGKEFTGCDCISMVHISVKQL